MPPPQHLLASKIRGFVCQSCTLKLKGPPRPRIPWAIRSVSTETVHSRRQGAIHPTPDFKDPQVEDQVEDEAEFDEESILKTLEEEIRARRIDAAEHGASTPGGVPKSAVRYFDETPDGVRKEVEDDADGDTLDAMEKDLEDLKSDTEVMLESLMGGNAGSSPLADNLRAEILAMECADLANMSEADRTRLRNRILETSDSAPIDSSYATPSFQPGLDLCRTPSQLDSVAEDVKITEDVYIPVSEFPVAQHYRVQQLNDALRMKPTAGRSKRGKRTVLRATGAADKSHLLQVWKAYSLCRNALMSAGHAVPRKTWIKLWNIFQVEGSHNLDRWAHLKTLGDDMIRVGVFLDHDRRLMHFEATFIEGDQSRAILSWENSSIRKDSQYWELGARMLAQHGEPEKALKAAVLCLQQSEASTSYRLLLPIIRAYLHQNTESSIKLAWAVYVRMRVSYSQFMTMEDYDIITNSFLDANQSDLALGIFIDMMLTGQSSASSEDSTSQYIAATGTHDELNSLEIVAHELNWQSPRALSKLPARMSNKFFMGKWMKKLIGNGDLDGAKKVLELMIDRQIVPSPIQMNGLIGAWFREGSEKNRALAEDMAWRMIQARNDFVKQRLLRQRRLDSRLRLRPVESTDLPSTRILTPTPSATIETFSVLLSQYRRRQKAHRMGDLLEAFEKSGIPPNTQFMNELLLTNRRAHDKDSALETYQTATEEQGISPDYNTYKVLWGLLKKEVEPMRGRNRPSSSERYHRCRNLFADMVSKLPKPTTEKFPQDLYRLIVQTFSIAQDLPGTAVAIRALQRHFDAYPDSETARIVVLQLSRLGLMSELGKKKVRLNTNSSITQARIASVANILRQLKDEREKSLVQQGVSLTTLKGRALKEEALEILLDLLKFAERQVSSEAGQITAQKSQQTATLMGVPDCPAWEDDTRSM
ncbi:uncharacterized protein RCO7_06655 [Rhynchosporium graminicola]|uniref:Pentatricopeptide repeat protein n=1 Tax=Rhynchosporium graminicola TaxID=2792576 RepID=A0A1E1K9A4_9HELO|nr:uncharacterized protein RCO7_06655 [Rhynchosporium commune]